ncbi:hypothetical protein RA277_28165, partial [Pseudomonas syringae pv. tagetis]
MGRGRVWGVVVGFWWGVVLVVVFLLVGVVVLVLELSGGGVCGFEMFSRVVMVGVFFLVGPVEVYMAKLIAAQLLFV